MDQVVACCDVYRPAFRAGDGGLLEMLRARLGSLALAEGAPVSSSSTDAGLAYARRPQRISLISHTQSVIRLSCRRAGQGTRGPFPALGTHTRTQSGAQCAQDAIPPLTFGPLHVITVCARPDVLSCINKQKRDALDNPRRLSLTSCDNRIGPPITFPPHRLHCLP